MKSGVLLLLSLYLILASCSDAQHKPTIETILSNEAVVIPNIQVEKSKLNYNPKKSIWTLDKKLYSGYAVTLYSDGSLKEKTGIFNGRKQNEDQHWYADGQPKSISNYHKGKLHGEKITWSTDVKHTKITHLNYHLGKVHGEQKKWYPSGEVFQILNLDMGIEKGIQQAFRKNGVLYANYEVVNGRIFGLKKAALCFGLEDENIKNEI